MWVITAWQDTSPEVTVEGPRQWTGLMMVCCGMTVKMMGILVVECEEDDGTDCENGDSDTDWQT
jgi:hypothetical protein